MIEGHLAHNIPFLLNIFCLVLPFWAEIAVESGLYLISVKACV